MKSKKTGVLFSRTPVSIWSACRPVSPEQTA
nr:MAG TPA: hypothetical protein [Caudoviricetes sp.]